MKESAKRVAEKSISMAASKLGGAADNADVGVSVDRTWQRKGFTSLNGFIKPYLLIVEKSLIQQFYPKVAKAVPKCRR